MNCAYVKMLIQKAGKFLATIVQFVSVQFRTKPSSEQSLGQFLISVVPKPDVMDYSICLSVAMSCIFP